MGLITGLSATERHHDGIWVIVDRLTKSAHFKPVWMKSRLCILAKSYVDKMIAFHGVPKLTASDEDLRFTSHFYESLQ